MIFLKVIFTIGKVRPSLVTRGWQRGGGPSASALVGDFGKLTDGVGGG